MYDRFGIPKYLKLIPAGSRRRATRSQRLVHLFVGINMILILICLVILNVVASRERMEFNSLLASMREVPVATNLRAPISSQDDIDFAMVLYSITRDEQTSRPVFSAELEDRGQTIGGIATDRKAIVIGRAAFSSWAVLGSTLGHEIEIHGRQSFLKIILDDHIAQTRLTARSLWNTLLHETKRSANTSVALGTTNAEREAYQFEMNSQMRFGLSTEEIDSINRVMETYYPSDQEVATH